MSFTIVSIAIGFFAFFFIALLVLFFAGDAQARLTDRMEDHDWAARQTKTNPPGGDSV